MAEMGENESNFASICSYLFFLLFFSPKLKSEKPPHGTATGAMQELVNCIYFGYFFSLFAPFPLWQK